MRDEIKYAIWLVGAGMALIVYAHANFATKSTVERMDERIYDIWKEIKNK